MSPTTPEVADLDLQQRLALAETAEAEFMHAFEAGAPPEAQEALGMVQHRVGGGVVLAMAHDPTGGYWSKALGFGVTEPVTADLVAQVVDIYRSNGDAVGVSRSPRTPSPRTGRTSSLGTASSRGTPGSSCSGRPSSTLLPR